MSKYEEKIDKFIFEDINSWKNLKILEFGVRFGVSTKRFLKLIEKNGGHLYSVDVDDYSDISSSKNWTFIKSRDDDFEYIEKKIPNEVDIILLDSFHNANHVKKILYHYYKKLKYNGLFFIDDISWLPYLKEKKRNSFNCEINNLETYEKILEIYNSNNDNIDIFFSFQDSGMVKIIKKNDKTLNSSKPMSNRKFSIKNLIRKLVYR